MYRTMTTASALPRPVSLRAPRAALPSGAEALGAWAAARAAAYEVTAQRRDADGAMVDRAIEIVRAFIVERGLVLFGGLAIDYALRLRGASIYPEDQRPDFDFLSTRNVDDAYDLADRLHRAGFEGVGAVRAIHVQTVKVRTDFIWVADVGHVPPDVFARIPTFDYQGMRVVHPDFQRMDQHLAFCFPFNGPPREDVFHRWRKDLKRFNLLDAHYPIAAVPAAARPTAAGAPRFATATGRFTAPVVGRGAELVVALHGFAAYALLRASLDELAAAVGAPPPVLGAPRLRLAFPDAHTVAVECPVGAPVVVVASPWPERALAGAARFEPFLDVCPETFHLGGAVGFSTRGRLLAASTVRVATADGAAMQARVVSPQYLLLWLLMGAMRADAEPDRAAFRGYYAHTLEILRAAEALYAGSIARGGASADAEGAALDSFAASPFAPTIVTLGDRNLDASYIVKMAANAARLRDTPPAALGLDADIAALLEGLPANYYPATSKQRPVFDYDASPLFRRSGRAVVAPSAVIEMADEVVHGMDATATKDAPADTTLV